MATAASAPNSPAPAAPAVEQTPQVGKMCSCSNGYNRFVSWLNQGTPVLNLNKIFGLNEANCTITKIVKVFAALLAAVVIIPLGCLGNFVRATGNFLLGGERVKGSVGATGDPVTTNNKEANAATAVVEEKQTEETVAPVVEAEKTAEPVAPVVQAEQAAEAEAPVVEEKQTAEAEAPVVEEKQTVEAEAPVVEEKQTVEADAVNQ